MLVNPIKKGIFKCEFCGTQVEKPDLNGCEECNNKTFKFIFI